MDTSYRNKEKSQSNSQVAKKEQNQHISDNYNAKIKPRRTSGDSISADKRIEKNLTRLNSEMIENPIREKNAVSRHKTEDTGAKIVTKRAKVKSPIPFSIILGSLIVTAVIMYTLSLSVKIEEYSLSISKIENDIAELQATYEQLDGKLETKYDLSEVQRIATEEYGMVTTDTLPKKYLNVSRSEEHGEAIGNSNDEESGLSKLLSGFSTAIRGLLE